MISYFAGHEVCSGANNPAAAAKSTERENIQKNNSMMLCSRNKNLTSETLI